MSIAVAHFLVRCPVVSSQFVSGRPGKLCFLCAGLERFLVSPETLCVRGEASQKNAARALFLPLIPLPAIAFVAPQTIGHRPRPHPVDCTWQRHPKSRSSPEKIIRTVTPGLHSPQAAQAAPVVQGGAYIDDDGGGFGRTPRACNGASEC